MHCNVEKYSWDGASSFHAGYLRIYTHTHSHTHTHGYVTLIALLLHQCLHDRASMWRYSTLPLLLYLPFNKDRGQEEGTIPNFRICFISQFIMHLNSMSGDIRLNGVFMNKFTPRTIVTSPQFQRYFDRPYVTFKFSIGWHAYRYRQPINVYVPCLSDSG